MITIIVLLILAGVSISLVVGDNGVLTQAQNSKNKSEKAKFEEDMQLAAAELYAENAADFEYTMSSSDLIKKLQDNYGYSGKLADNGKINIGGQDYTVSVTEDGKATLGEKKTVQMGDAAGLYGVDGTFTAWDSLTKTVTDGALISCEITKEGGLVIPSSVTSIGNNVFKNCTNLVDIRMPNTITSIGGYAFYKCSGLTGTLTLPSGVTSIGTNAFTLCSGLTGTLTLPSGVTSIGGYAFSSCKGLMRVIIPSSVTSIGDNVFNNCIALTSVTFSNGLTTIGYQAFVSCRALTSITIPSSVTSIHQLSFQGCSGLESIVVDSENTIYDSRNNCNAIIETSTNKVVTGCKNTTFPNTVTTIGSCAFIGCKGLTSLMIPSNITSINNNAFQGCSGLESIVVDSENTIYDSRDNCNAIIKTSNNQLIQGCKNTIISNTVTSIGNNAFNGCTSLTNILIPSSVTSIGASAFESCTSLTNIILPNTLTYIGNRAFISCRGLTSITIPGSVITFMSQPFQSCSSLTSVIISNGITSIPIWAFRNCNELTSVMIPSTVTSISEYAFEGMKEGSTIYVQTEAVKNLLNSGNYSTDKTTIVVDPSKF